VPEPAAEEDFMKVLNPKSLETVNAKLEPSLASAGTGERFQFERLGYFTVDSRDSTLARLVFNRTITLRDTWAK
jgi:glutaminyl-tRNA synthetase